MTVTLSDTSETAYDGTNPSPAGFDVVVSARTPRPPASTWSCTSTQHPRDRDADGRPGGAALAPNFEDGLSALSDPDVQQLYINAVAWSSGVCDADADGSMDPRCGGDLGRGASALISHRLIWLRQAWPPPPA